MVVMKCVFVVQECAFVYVILLLGIGCGFCISLLVTVSKYSYREVSIKLVCIARSKRDGTRAETRFGLSAKRMNPFKLAGVSVQSTAGS